MGSKADRDLHRELARIATLDPEDLDAILDLLEPGQRERVVALVVGPTAPKTAPASPSRYPDWLGERVDGRIEGITSRFRATLMTSAERHFAVEPTAPSPRSLSQILLSGLSRLGRSA